MKLISLALVVVMMLALSSCGAPGATAQQNAAFTTESTALTFASIAVLEATAQLNAQKSKDPLTVAAELSVLDTVNTTLETARDDLANGKPWTQAETNAVGQGFISDINAALAAKGYPPLIIVFPTTAPATQAK